MRRKRKQIKKELMRKMLHPSEIKAMDDDKNDRKMKFVISTSTPDRDGDIIEASGWDLSNYKKNPVVLFAHDNWRPPVGKGISVEVDGDKLIAEAEFMDESIDKTGFSETIYQMLKHGYLNATSIGMIPHEWDIIKDDNGEIKGFHFKKQELLEFSIVPVPANPEALSLAQEKGINIDPLEDWFEEALDCWTEYKNFLILPKKEIETLYRKAKRLTKGKTKMSKENKDTNVEEKMVIPYDMAHPDGTPKEPRESDWDGPYEVTQATVSDLMTMCAWHEDKPEGDLVKEDFKLPHHRAEGEHAVVWRGVVAAMAALMGARGGVDVPEEDRRGIYNHLSLHYEEFDETPPEFKHVEEQTLKSEEFYIDTITGQIKQKVREEEKNDKECEVKGKDQKNKETMENKDNSEKTNTPVMDKNAETCKEKYEYYVSIKQNDLVIEIKTNSLQETKELLKEVQDLVKDTQKETEKNEKVKDTNIATEKSKDKDNLDELLKSVVQDLPNLIDETLKEKLGN